MSMRSKFLGLACFAVALTPAMSTPALATTDVAAECDRLAGDPDDPGRRGDGVRFAKIEADLAIAACGAAVEASPTEGRLHYQLGRAYAHAKRAEDAIEAYRAAAAADYPMGWVGIGQLYEHGDGIEPDPVRAFEHYRLAHEAGSAAGTAAMASFYSLGLGVEKDLARAVTLFKEAAAAGDAFAQFELGYRYEKGEGVPRDEAEAVRLYRASAEQGWADGQNSLGAMYAEGRGGLSQDFAEAAKWFKQAFEQDRQPGSGWAASNLAQLHAWGRGAPEDKAEAERLFRYAIASPDAAVANHSGNALAYWFALEGRNLEEAEKLARAAVAHGEAGGDKLASSLDTLAWVLHRQGRNEEALETVQKAIGQDESNAVFHAHRGDILDALGRHEEARSAWTKALELPPPNDPQGNGFDPEAIRAKLSG